MHQILWQPWLANNSPVQKSNSINFNRAFKEFRTKRKRLRLAPRQPMRSIKQIAIKSAWKPLWIRSPTNWLEAQGTSSDSTIQPLAKSWHSSPNRFPIWQRTKLPTPPKKWNAPLKTLHNKKKDNSNKPETRMHRNPSEHLKEKTRSIA